MNSFLVRGLGFFNGSYDLLVMNVVNALLAEQYGTKVYDRSMKSAVSAAALIGAVIGQLLFGILGDLYGRKKPMVATCVILIVGGILCACAYGGTPERTLWFLVAARGLLGIGIGGEYPLAASTTAEDAKSIGERNYRVAMTFSLQGVASLIASILGNLLVQALANEPQGQNQPHRIELVWRLLFAIGVLPACVVCYYRVTAEETLVFRTMQARRQAIAVAHNEKLRPVSFRFIVSHYGWGLLGTAGTWFLFDIVFYSQNLFSTTILTVIGLKNASLQQTTTQNAFVALMALPGYYVAVFFINSVGRKQIQLQGFAFMTILFLCLGTLWDDLKHNAVAFILLYGLALFFSNFGPNMSTFIMPTEMFPTPIRSTCHGFSAACGKAGAAIGSFGFSLWVDSKSLGYSGTFFIFAGITLVSIPLTWFCMFDNEQGFEDVDEEFFEKVQEERYLGINSFAVTNSAKDAVAMAGNLSTSSSDCGQQQQQPPLSSGSSNEGVYKAASTPQY
ncbi:Inorganic phosphate transporter [Globisporangium polare]